MFFEFYKLRAGQKFRIGKQIFMKVYNPFKSLKDAGIITAINLDTATVCHCDDDELVELINEREGE